MSLYQRIQILCQLGHRIRIFLNLDPGQAASFCPCPPTVVHLPHTIPWLFLPNSCLAFFVFFSCYHTKLLTWPVTCVQVTLMQTFTEPYLDLTVCQSVGLSACLSSWWIQSWEKKAKDGAANVNVSYISLTCYSIASVGITFPGARKETFVLCCCQLNWQENERKKSSERHYSPCRSNNNNNSIKLSFFSHVLCNPETITNANIAWTKEGQHVDLHIYFL